MYLKKIIIIVVVITFFSSTLFSYNNKPINEIKMSGKTSDVITGTVLEKIDGGDNLFFKLYDNIDSIFVLAPKNIQTVKIEKGNRLVISNLSYKNNYEDKFLSRTFEYLLIAKSIINMEEFVTQEDNTAAEHVHTENEDPAIHATSTSTEKQAKNPHQSSTNSGVPTTDVKVEKVAGGYTVAELYAKVDELVGKEVTIQAKIVKYSPNIMSNNWLHIQDGSGNAANGDNDLVVVSKEPFSKGETVTLRGKLGKDHNLGSGYLYHVIILDAVKIK